MITEELIKDIGKFARTLVRDAYDEDYRDLVQSTCERLLSHDSSKHNFQYACTICKNLWRDRLAYKAVRRMNKSLESFAVDPTSFMPQVLEEIECKEQGKSIHDWPGPNRTLQQEKARLRMARLYAKRKEKL